jgi:hypothetical protein
VSTKKPFRVSYLADPKDKVSSTTQASYGASAHAFFFCILCSYTCVPPNSETRGRFVALIFLSKLDVYHLVNSFKNMTDKVPMLSLSENATM